jgi:hypothetical protein
MITGDHLDANTCLLAGRDGFDGLWTRRIDDADQSKKYHALVEISDREIALIIFGFTTGGGKDPQALAA